MFCPVKWIVGLALAAYFFLFSLGMFMTTFNKDGEERN
jgi:hypothetical protein